MAKVVSIILTEAERRERGRRYGELEQKLAEGADKVSKEEALQALGHLATLVDDRRLDVEQLQPKAIVAFVRRATGLSVTEKGKRRKKVFGAEEVASHVSVLRGVTLGLSWDKRVLSVEIDPREVRRMRLALAFVGFGRDAATDVAAHHDDYLAGVSLRG